MSISRLAIVIAAAALAAGCADDIYLLKSTYVASSQTEARPEIIETKAYRDNVRKITTVAVRAPDSCANQTVDTTTGSAASAATVLKTQCGVEMVEVERALTKKGYRVISWTVLAREMGSKANESKTPTQIAASLGAQVLFQINSLEQGEKTLGKDARWERTYYKSNKFGEELAEEPFPEQTRKFFKDKYLEEAERKINLRRLSVTLDASAVLVKTGESIWYYRWTHADPQTSDTVSKVLIVCEDVKDRECVPLRIREPAAPKAGTVKAAGESEAVSVIERPEDRTKAVYARLLQEAVASLVASFSRELGTSAAQ